MTIVLVEGFDLYNGTGANTGLGAKYSITIGNGTAISLTTGRFSSGRCIQCDVQASSRGYMTRLLSSSYSAFAFGSAMKIGALTSATIGNPCIAFWDSAGGWQLGIGVDSNGAIHALRLAGETSVTDLGASANGVIIANTWHYIELEVGTISATTGTFKIYVDGILVVNLTNVNNKNATNANVGYVKFGCNSTSANTSYYFDDVYMTDSATRLGERRVETIYPDGDVTQTFARSTGSTNYTLVNEAQVNGDTNYVQGSTVGDTDTYSFGNLSSTPANVSAIQVTAFAEKTDATSRSIALQIKSGATASDGSNYALAAAYAKYERIMETDPNTSAAWTASGVNGVQGGPKVTV